MLWLAGGFVAFGCVMLLAAYFAPGGHDWSGLWYGILGLGFVGLGLLVALVKGAVVLFKMVVG